MAIAVTALILSILAIAWDIVRFIREGARVKVTLRPGVLDEIRLTSCRVRTDLRCAGGGVRFGIEVAVIDVENCGRTAITVRDVGLDLGRESRWRRGRCTVSFPLVPFDGCVIEQRNRIEPYDSARYIVDMGHALWTQRPTSAGRLVVRAFADVAGMRKKLSARRTRWRFRDGEQSRLFAVERFDLAKELYRFMYWRTQPATLARLMLPKISTQIAERVERGEPQTCDTIRAIIDGCLNDLPGERYPSALMLEYVVADTLAQPGGTLFDRTGFELERGARSAGPPVNAPVNSP